MAQSVGSLHNFLHRNFSNHQHPCHTDGKEPLLSFNFFFHRIYFDHISPPLTIPRSSLFFLPTQIHLSLFNTHTYKEMNGQTNKKLTKIIIKQKSNSFCVGRLLLGLGPAWECGWYTQWYAHWIKLIPPLPANNFLLGGRGTLCPFSSLNAGMLSDLSCAGLVDTITVSVSWYAHQSRCVWGCFMESFVTSGSYNLTTSRGRTSGWTFDSNGQVVFSLPPPSHFFYWLNGINRIQVTLHERRQQVAICGALGQKRRALCSTWRSWGNLWALRTPVHLVLFQQQVKLLHFQRLFLSSSGSLKALAGRSSFPHTGTDVLNLKGESDLKF